MDPGADLAQLSSLGEERADLTLCSTNEEIASYEIHDMHSNTNTLLSRSCQTERLFLTGGYVYSKDALIQLNHKLFKMHAFL